MKEFTLHQQKAITRKIVKSLVALGFTTNKFPGRLHGAFKGGVAVVQPPDFDKSCPSWNFLIWDTAKDASCPWVGGSGTLSFSAQWATAENVMAAVLEQVHFYGYCSGISKTREKITVAIAALNEAAKRI